MFRDDSTVFVSPTLGLSSLREITWGDARSSLLSQAGLFRAFGPTLCRLKLP
jgi:hypothetical protein